LVEKCIDAEEAADLVDVTCLGRKENEKEERSGDVKSPVLMRTESFCRQGLCTARAHPPALKQGRDGYMAHIAERKELIEIRFYPAINVEGESI
jgi:hypothetical protein